MFKIIAVLVVLSTGQMVGPFTSQKDFPDEETCKVMAELQTPALKQAVEAEVGKEVAIQWKCEVQGQPS